MTGDATDLRRAIPATVGGARCAPSCPSVAEATVAEIIVEVPSYADAFTGDMGRVIGNAVELALGGFLELATASGGADAEHPDPPGAGGRVRAGSRRGAQRAHRWTRCSPPTGSAPASPGGT